MNASFSSSTFLDTVHDPEKLSNIPVQIGFRPAKLKCETRPPAWKRVKRDNRKIQALSLPVILNYNMRSFFPKYSNFCEDMEERECDVAFLSEVWENGENKKHQFKITEMLELRGIDYISTPRPGRGGGGVGIAARKHNFTLKKLNISIPQKLEVVWGLLRPKLVTGKITVIIVCSFYSPPGSRKKNALIDHLTSTLQTLLTNHPTAGVIISGDRNDLDNVKLLSIDKNVRQIVSQPTRGPNILDVVLTDLSKFFCEPQIVPPVAPDVPGKGVPSDHNGVIVKPLRNLKSQNQTNIVKKIRPIPESMIPFFGLKLKNTDFKLDKKLSLAEMVDLFQNKLQVLVTEIFPEKKIRISKEDQPYFNEHLRSLKRKRQREYTKHGKSTKYLQLKATFEEKRKCELEKYKEKILNEVANSRRGSVYPTLKKLALRPGDHVQSS